MQRAWLREFNAGGLQLRPQAAKLVTDFLTQVEDPQQMAQTLVEHTKNYIRSRQGRMEPFVGAEVIAGVLECLAEGDGLSAEAAMQGVDTHDLGDGIQVYDATTDVRAFDFHRATRAWIPAAAKPNVLPSPDAKAKIYADRYHLLLQRTLLEGSLVAEEEAAAAGGVLLPGQRVLTKVESLQGNPGEKITFGLISRLHDDSARRWVIEDLHKVFPVDLVVEDAERLITDGTFVLAEGRVSGGRFVVHRLDVPQAVPRQVTLGKDQVPRQVFGGALTDEQLDILQLNEADNKDGFYVVLCEVHLDSVRVLDRLSDLFQGYEQVQPPSAYVFMGSFCSKAFVAAGGGVQAYRDGFERVKFMMRGLVNHARNRTRFIFVPGPNDPGANMLPQVPLPAYLTADLAKELPNVVLASNPCRVRHFSKELVFFRHDVLRLLRRHEVVALKEPGNEGPPSVPYVRQEVVRLILDQAHLAPLPLEQSNILWAFDHALRLCPLPDAVFVGGVGQPFNIKYKGCEFCSVGPFQRDAEFYAYYPIKGELQPCDVPDRAG